MSYDTWQNSVLDQANINNDQKQRLLAMVQTPMPDFNPTLASDLTAKARAKGDAWLAGTPSAPQALNPYISNDSTHYANALSHVADTLRIAKENYAGNQMDIERALNNNQMRAKDYLSKLGMAFDTGAAIDNRNAQTQVSEIGRQADYSSMKSQYQRQIDSLKAQADEAKRRGDMAAWLSIIGVIGKISGAIATGGVSAAL
jgi:hypothetical protein